MDELLRDSIAEMSLVVTKASFDKSEPDPNKKRRILLTNSDVSPDLYKERMSVELFNEFTKHIENKDSIPEPFASKICEDSWCGGMPYLSVAHYQAGRDSKNVPGMPESVYVDGKQLKSKAYLYDNPMGRALFDSLCKDEQTRKSGVSDFDPVRVSIGFLDLEHIHEVNGKSFLFERKSLGQKCPLCEKGEGGKIYKKGHLVHLAATRKPVNPRTEMGLEEKSMDDITTKHEDAASIIGEELANTLEEKSLVNDELVIKSETPEQDDLKVELATVKSTLDEVLKSLENLQGKHTPVVEESMETEVITKAEEKEEPKKDEKKEEAKEEKSALDTKFEELKSVIASAKSPDELQAAYNALGQEVQKAYVAPAPSATDIAEIVKSAVEAAVAPLKMQLAQLQAGTQQVQKSTQMNPVTRALTLTPAELTQRSVQPTRQLTQIERIARQSTGATV